MKARICDICGKPYTYSTWKIKIKQEQCSWWEYWWKKIDICTECGEKLITDIREKLKENLEVN